MLKQRYGFQARGTPVGKKSFLREAKFYIDSMYENDGYAYNLSLHIL